MTETINVFLDSASATAATAAAAAAGTSAALWCQRREQIQEASWERAGANSIKAKAALRI